MSNGNIALVKTKYIFVTGGVVSSLGKGIAAASIGTLLESRGIKINMVKLDPYINVDPGTMSPYQHGEVYVTEDGSETDLDLGHYERYTQIVTNKSNNFTTGQVYYTVIEKERKGEYLGRTVQVIPHITDQIKENIIHATKDCEVAIIEIGGTVGDIESLPFLESIRQFKHELPNHQVLYLHLTLIPFIASAEELKTKPTQHSVNKLREIGIQPDMLICRTDRPLDKETRKKIALFTNVDLKSVCTAIDVKNIYEIPLKYHNQMMDEIIIEKLGIQCKSPDLKAWQDIQEAFNNCEGEVVIAIIGKYTELKDSYKSLHEALSHAAICHRLQLKINYINTEDVKFESYEKVLKDCHGILIPGGFGERGTEEKITAVKYARERKIPFFGICLGLQISVIEFARNVVGIQGASSSEFTPKGKANVIDLMSKQKEVVNKGGTMRLGAYEVKLQKGTKIRQIYGQELISERHRHRYEVNNEYLEVFKMKGLIISGMNPDINLVETIELEAHPWFIGIQAHPELKSKPTRPHPLFVSFIKASYQNTKKMTK